MGKKITESLPWIAVALVAFGAYGLSSGMARTLLTPLWIPVSSALFLTIAAAWWAAPLWRKVTGSASKIVNCLFHTAVVTGVVMALLLGVNYAGAGEPVVDTVPVVGSYTTTGHQMRRLRRGVYVKGHAYTKYYVKLKLPDDNVKSITVSRERYNKLRRTRRAEVELRRGLLGMEYFRLL